MLACDVRQANLLTHVLEIRAERDLVTLKEQQLPYLRNTRFDMDKFSMPLFSFTFFCTLRAMPSLVGHI